MVRLEALVTGVADSGWADCSPAPECRGKWRSPMSPRRSSRCAAWTAGRDAGRGRGRAAADAPGVGGPRRRPSDRHRPRAQCRRLHSGDGGVTVGVACGADPGTVPSRSPTRARASRRRNWPGSSTSASAASCHDGYRCRAWARPVGLSRTRRPQRRQPVAGERARRRRARQAHAPGSGRRRGRIATESGPGSIHPGVEAAMAVHPRGCTETAQGDAAATAVR